MNYEFLKRLFTACSDEEGGHYADGLNLPELYKRMDEVGVAVQRLGEAKDEAGLTLEMADVIHSAAYELALAYEWLGFVNGFRLCAQLRRELGDMEVRA